MRTAVSVDSLFPKTRQAILAATFGEPHRWWYMRGLARHLRLTPSSLQRELASLVRGGILLQKREGKHVYFKAAADSPIFPELQGLILKTVGLADVVRGVLKPLADRIQWAFIYGSVARSEEHSASDVDLIIIGNVGLADVSSPLRKAERRLNRSVNPTTYTKDEFGSKVESNHHFISTIMRSKKLFILGDPREFGRAFVK
jgi:predicted nucleotidyltransferase/DNA-binding transcriptional ArsR family regulator